MRLLDPCTALWGTAEIHDADPKVTVVRDGFYLPYAHNQGWGLFEDGGRPVAAAADFREGVHLPPDQVLETRLTGAEIAETAPNGVYIYGGRINPHFGHFLINTLPRFWAMTQVRSPQTPILCHGPGTPDEWFGVPFIAAAFGLIGLSPRDFVTFDGPMRLRAVVVPSTSLEEQRAGYKAYAKLCLAIGDRLRARHTIEPDDRPIYYSKTRLRSAVGVITNESEIEAVLSAAGVEIIYPETLSFAQQVCLMSERKNILGSAGSFLHTSIFCPPRRITCLNVTDVVNSNYTIIDALAGNQSTYSYPPALQVLERQDGFLTSRYLPEAAAVAEELRDLSCR